MSDNQFILYEHHGNVVWTRMATMGKHRELCLCWSCEKLKPGTAENCPIAQALYELDVKHKLVTPVFECPVFNEALLSPDHFHGR